MRPEPYGFESGVGPCSFVPDVIIRMSRDPTGNKFLECAVSGGAGYVVSAGADLLSLREVRGIPLLDVPTFWQTLTEHRGQR